MSNNQRPIPLLITCNSDIMSNLKHLQSLLLSIMKEIDAICKKHGIIYYLNGGNALGAIRHNGFIPWDDDFDIMMHSDDYKKFISVCRQELDPERWYVQEAWVDWPCCFSKIRLKGTYFEDIGEWKGVPEDCRGVFIDVFELVNAPDSKFQRLLQYTSAKMLTAHSLLLKGYQTDSTIKKATIFCSRILQIKIVFNLTKSMVYRYNNKINSTTIGNLFGMSRLHNAFYDKEVFGTPFYHKYEDMELPLPAKYEVYLTQAFGDYMTLPPVDKRKPAHSLTVDFGKY